MDERRLKLKRFPVMLPSENLVRRPARALRVTSIRVSRRQGTGLCLERG
jgi:hypothetical protein